MTLEEAQEQILQLTEERDNLKTELDTLSQDKDNLTTELESVRTLNQKYFNKLIAQEQKSDDSTEDEDDPISCEDFAKSLNI